MPAVRIKLNSGHVPHHIPFQSKLWNKFRDEMEVLLDPKTNHYPLVGRAVERKAIRDSLESDASFLRFITGPTGIGKTHLVRSIFGENLQTNVTGSGDGRTLTIPMDLDGRSVPFAPLLAAFIRNAADLLRPAQPDDPKQLHAYIAAHRSEMNYLVSDAVWRKDATASITQLERMQEFAHAVLLLKFSLSLAPVGKIIVVCDDIESLHSWEEQQDALWFIGHLFQCLKQGGTANVRSQFFFICRGETLAVFKRFRQLSPYLNDAQPIDIIDSVPLDEMFKSRLETVLSGKIPTRVKVQKDWEDAYEVLMKLNARVNFRRAHGSRSDFIAELCNHNIRDAFNEYLRLLANRRYLERANSSVVDPGRDAAGAFDLRFEDFNLNEAVILRALALRDGDVYPGFETKVPNLIANTAAPESDMIGIYIMRYIEGTHLHGGAVMLEEAEMFAHLFTDHRFLLRREIYVHQIYDRLVESGLVQCEGGARPHLRLAPRAKAALASLEHLSVWLDFARDDTYVPASRLGHKNLAGRLSERLVEDEKIEARLELVRHLAETEREHVEEVEKDHSGALYYTHFAQPRLVSDMCLAGVSNTLRSYYQETAPPTHAVNAVESLRKYIAETLRILADACPVSR